MGRRKVIFRSIINQRKGVFNVKFELELMTITLASATNFFALFDGIFSPFFIKRRWGFP